MAGASANHGRLSGTIFNAFFNQLNNTPCEPFLADMKVKVGTKFFYPDVMVACDDEKEDYYRQSPLIIVEVLSHSTRKRDHTLKRLNYQSLPSLKEYVLIEQAIVDVEICRRDNHWQPEHYYLGDKVYFAAIDLYLPVDDIYARVVNDENAYKP
jgi:Uma2 family endonuclease